MPVTHPLSSRLSLQPRDGEKFRVNARAEYFAGQIDTKLFRVRHPQYQPLLTNPLVLEPERQRYVFISKFGAVVFWNCTPELTSEILDAMKALPGTIDRVESVADEMVINIGSEVDAVTFNEVDLRELTLEKLKIISLAFGQSVALDHIEQEVSRVLQRFDPVVEALRLHGKLILSPQEVLRAIGFSFDVRSAVLANLTLFDSPPETWESEALARLDTQLYDYFDIEERVSAINQKLAYMNDLHTMLMDMLHQRNSARLEWIIIILICVEVVFSFGKEFGPALFH
jgi:uncharacterized Rmd1/YagE family protein